MDIDRLEHSLRATEAVGSVVRAVWALSRAQLPRMQEAVQDAITYLDWVDAVVDRLAGPPRPSELERSLTVVLGPERSFSGTLAQTILEHAPPTGPLGLVGARLGEVSRRDPTLRERVVFEIPGPVSVDELADASADLTAAILASCADAPVDVLHPHLGAGGARGLRRTLLLATEREAGRSDYDLYSAADDVLRAAVREALTGRVRILLAQSLEAEIVARVDTADRARRAIEDRLETLARGLRVQMQEQTTRELLEIVSGRL
jgi:F0F1-type ATP synthase gamma subunit